ncbi:hypothetical protein BpHYR1_020506 [Brachionus plicatilis]|uniref:Uncharacterized protein n=1 Tax=Brachionus plicatilis TaxID=10195 RepID=A0A3M7QDD0_BRAPC|nr:hypothetical protein BpHYR1_020506 [Brachionus plicatilis]
MKINLKKLKTILVIILFSMVTNVENYDSSLVAAENNRIHKEKFYESLERLAIERVENDLLNPDKKK